MSKLAKIIVLDGVDASGKATQAQMLHENLVRLGYKSRLLSFPNYESESSALVKMYLNGAWGNNATSVNPYAAASAYALDRFSTMQNVDLASYDVLVMDRYTSSNAIHQASKLSGEEKSAFLDWIFRYEHEILKIPRPDKVLFLDMPPEYGAKLMEGRALKSGTKQDIHENAHEYLLDSYLNATHIARKFNWQIVSCVKEQEIQPPEDIQDVILGIALGVLGAK